MSTGMNPLPAERVTDKEIGMPAQTGTASKPAPAAPAPSVPDQAAQLLLDYVAYRREQMRKQTGAQGPGRSGAAMIQARESENFLAQLAALAAWLQEGTPNASTVLSEADRAFWKNAKDRGLDVPPEILEQL